MKKKNVLLPVAVAAAVMLSACGASNSTEPAASSEAVSSSAVESEAASAVEEKPEATEAPAPAAESVAEEVDVGGPYPATTDWDEYAVVDYYFEETDETVPMLIETNADHTKYNTLFDFFGDKQEMSFSVNGDELTVENDLTGFIGKDVEKISTFINENVTDWAPISADGAAATAAAGDEVDVGGPYPATTNWDEYTVVDYYFAETDETVPMLIETNADHTKFETLFGFFGDKQDMSFSVNGDDLTVDDDLTGFIGKDVEKIYTFIQENVTEWTPIA